MTVTAEGLRIELLESETGTFFETAARLPSASGKEMLIALAGELGKLPNKISMEGHTDARPYSGGSEYSNWELSADRANAARRLMQQNGVHPARWRRSGGMPISSCANRTNRKTPRTEGSL